MEKQLTRNPKKSTLGVFLKGFLIILSVIVLVGAGGYFYLKFKLNFDIFEFKKGFDLLSKPTNESVLLTNPFDYSDAEEAYFAIFSDDEIYKEVDGAYVFSPDKFNAGAMNSDTDLTDRQLAAALSVYLNNGGFDTGEEEDLKSLLQVKQISFGNFSEDEESFSIDINYVLKLDFKNIKQELKNGGAILAFVNKYVPESLYINSTFNLNKSKTESFSYSATQKSFRFNQLSQDETKKTLKILEFLFKDETNVISQYFDNLFCEMLFGTSDDLGFLQKINGAMDFEFRAAENPVICIKHD